MKRNGQEEMFRQLALHQAGKKPRKRPEDIEHEVQVQCVNWFKNLQHRKDAENLFAVPNGGWRNATTAGKLKAEGVTKGVADLILLKKNSQYGALLIEMKRPKRYKQAEGTQSDDQIAWQAKMEKDGYKYVVCHSLDEFINEVENYLRIK